MPIAKEVHVHQMEENKSKNNSNPSALEEEPHLLPTNELNWPTLSGNTSKKHGEESEDRLSESLDEWEHISSSGTLVSEIIAETTKVPIINRKSIHRCASTPEFSNLKDENSYVLECSDDNVEAQSQSTVAGSVLLSYVTDTSMRRVPSFKDIIMLNAQSEDEKKKKELLQQNQNKMREEALKKRKAIRPKLVVTPIKRCTKSTGNLRSLVIHEDQEEDTYGGSGGAIIHENEVLGDSDATEFYDRKKKGSLNRHNGSKFRPDEAKRKDMIIHKKNAQRKAQEGRVSSADKK